LATFRNILILSTIDLVGNVAEIQGLGVRLTTGTAGSYLWSRAPIACMAIELPVT